MTLLALVPQVVCVTHEVRLLWGTKILSFHGCRGSLSPMASCKTYCWTYVMVSSTPPPVIKAFYQI